MLAWSDAGRGGNRLDHQVPAHQTRWSVGWIEQAGYDAVYLSGGADSAGTMALPDVGLFTLTELVARRRYLARSVSIPVIVDADTGFGEAINVERTVGELEVAGAAAVQIEDQRLPSTAAIYRARCSSNLPMPQNTAAGNRSTKRSQPRDRGQATDARGVTSVDDAIIRARSVSGTGPATRIFPKPCVVRKSLNGSPAKSRHAGSPT